MLGIGAYAFSLPDAWFYGLFGNSILRKLKAECTKEPGNPVFWDEVKKNKIDLIIASEAARHGGRSNVPDSSAVRHLPGGSSLC
jgi:hypothetical protein